MNLDGKTLPEWLAIQDGTKFPIGFDYRSGYLALAAHLEAIHKQVTPTNIHIDGGYLTDHGPDHIRKLIRRISTLLEEGTGVLTPYEAYLLLAAAQFHDVGNIYGRAKHEERSAEVMRDTGKFLPTDAVEQRFIYQIAQAHGGEDKSKLDTLIPEDHVRGEKVRPQLLAALLKFADELAEDSERGARYSMEKGLLPPESEIYHAYALSLHSVVIDGLAHEVRLKFDIPKSKALRTFLKKSKSGASDKQVYLIDEILTRTVKTHFERVYCSRFMRSIIDLVSVSVIIEVTDDAGFNVLKKVSFRLQEAGYPETSGKDIYALCPELKNWDDNGALSGENLAAKLELGNGK